MIIMWLSYLLLFVLSLSLAGAQPPDIVDFVASGEERTSIALTGAEYSWRVVDSTFFIFSLNVSSTRAVSVLVERSAVRSDFYISGQALHGTSITISAVLFEGALSTDVLLVGAFLKFSSVRAPSASVSILVNSASQFRLEDSEMSSMLFRVNTSDCTKAASCVVLVQRCRFIASRSYTVPLTFAPYAGQQMTMTNTYVLIYNNSIGWRDGVANVVNPVHSFAMQNVAGMNAVVSVLLNAACLSLGTIGFTGSVEYWGNTGTCLGALRSRIALRGSSSLLVSSNEQTVTIEGSAVTGTPTRIVSCTEIDIASDGLNIRQLDCTSSTFVSRCREGLSVYDADTPRSDVVTARQEIRGCIEGTDWVPPVPIPEFTTLPMTTTPPTSTTLPSDPPTTETTTILLSSSTSYFKTTNQPTPMTSISGTSITTATFVPLTTTPSNTTVSPTPPTTSLTTIPSPPTTTFEINVTDTPAHIRVEVTAVDITRQVAGIGAFVALLAGDPILVVQMSMVSSVLELAVCEDTTWFSDRYNFANNPLHLKVGEGEGGAVRGGLLTAGLIVSGSFIWLILYSIVHWKRTERIFFQGDSHESPPSFSLYQFPSTLLAPLSFSALLSLRASLKLVSFSRSAGDIGVGCFVMVLVLVYAVHIILVLTMWFPGTVRYLPVPSHLHGWRRHFQNWFSPGGVWVAVRFGGSSQCLPSMGGGPRDGVADDAGDMLVVVDAKSSSVIWLSRFKAYLRMSHSHAWFVGLQLVVSYLLHILGSVGFSGSCSARNALGLATMIGYGIALVVLRPFAAKVVLGLSVLSTLFLVGALGVNLSNTTEQSQSPMIVCVVLSGCALFASFISVAGCRLSQFDFFGGRGATQNPGDVPAPKHRRRLAYSVFSEKMVRMLDA